MGDRRTPKPVLVLLLLFAALFAPTTPAASTAPSAGIAITRAVTPQEAAAQRGRTGAEHRSDRSEIRGTVATATAVPLPSTPVRDARLAAPRLLLVQRPRPPTSTYADSDVSAPTGRSPPSPAGT